MSFGDPKEAISNDVSLSDGVPRRFVNFQPSVWGDYFLSYDSTNLEGEDVVRKQLARLEEEVRNMLTTTETSSKKLRLIDLIQRLGLSYHYEVEINEILDHIFHNPYNVDFDEDLYMVALTFRLLRQQGHFVSCEIFNKFTNEMGAFKESIVKDKRGLLSLFEASHLRMNGENILDEALIFTAAHLEEIAMNSSSSLGEEVKYALEWPIFKAFPRLMSKHYISLYHNDPLHNNDHLLTFAKLDYNLLQKLYQKEVAQLTRWMKDLKLMERLFFTRDRTVECYAWALGIFYEPKYSRPRILLAKIVAFISALDDTYDVYATLDELEPFTNAIERWDMNDIEKLPDYMKFLYEAIFNIYNEIEQDICKEYNIPFALDYAKDQMKGLCKAYLMEAKWFQEGYVPSMEEYMKVATVSSSYYVFASISFIDLGANVVSNEVFEWAKNDPMLIKATGAIGRLLNDITSHKFEQERGHIVSAVECYTKQYGELKEEAVMIELEKLVVKAWKDLTEDYIKLSTQIPNVFLMRMLNLARVSDLFYKKEDGYTLVDGATKCFITTLLIDSII